MAECFNHPGAPEVARCDECGRPVCADCFIVLGARKLCGPCKGDAVRRVERGARLESGRRAASPWERQPSFATLRETVVRALLSPREFFATLALEGSGFWSYVLAIGWPAATLAAIIGYLIPALGTGPAALGDAANVSVLVALIALAPLQIALGIAIQGGILHLFLRLLGGATGRLETTVRAVAYAQSVLVFNWIPILGPIVGVVWMFVLMIVGVREMHGTTTGKALAAALLPLLLCGGAVGAAIGLAALAQMGR